MSDSEDTVTVLEDSKSWDFLQAHSLGRLAASAAGEIDIFPLNYFADGSTILLRTAPGTKLVEMTIHGGVAFEVDDYTDTEATSVVVKGTARWLDTESEIEEADRAPLVSWLPTLKYVYVRITPTTVSGRRFVRGPEPERYY